MAVRFLQAYAPEGPWVITAIVPDGGKAYTQTFGPTDAERCQQWIESHQGIKNIYFMVNPPTHHLMSKAKKSDVKEMAWLHVDVDPRVGEELEKERVRCRALLENFSIPPTLIIDSGGGFQGFWNLDNPIDINGDEGKCEEYEAYNQQLELLLGGDHCFNLDRIMRLPGTLNIPSEKKRKKGRTIALAEAVVWEPSRVYSLSQFTAAPRVQVGEEGFAGGGARVKISGNLPRIEDLDELPLKDRVKMVIVQGGDPDDPTKWNSRSETLFWVLCEMVRVGLDDDTIASIIMDPDFGVSASVLDKARPEQYAARQIQRAREEAIDPWLRKLNERHAVISDIGGKCRVISEVMEPSLGRPRLSRQTFDDFRNRYLHIRIVVGQNDKGDIIKAAGTWWLSHPNRRQYETVVFAPGRDGRDSYNLWRGFGCEAIPGECPRFMDHMREVICAQNEEHFKYLLGWMAMAVQKPDRPGEVAIVLRGKQGTGKGFFVKTFGSLFGRHFLQVADPKHLVGSFNSHLRDCLVLFGDEAFYAGDKKHEAVLKMLVTEERITFEAKGIDAEMGPNYVHLLLSSNSEWVVPAGAEERRFFALDVADSKIQNQAYFSQIDREMKNGGREALLHFLLTYDLTDFDVRSAPKTAALREQKELSFNAEQAWFHERLSDGVLLTSDDTWEKKVLVDSLYEDYERYCRNLRPQPNKVSRTTLGRFLKKTLGQMWPKKYQEWREIWRIDPRGQQIQVRARPYVYEFPTLVICRAAFDKMYGGPFEWPRVEAPPVFAQEEPPAQYEAF